MSKDLERIDTMEIDGLDETYAANADPDEIEVASVLLADFIIDASGSMGTFERVMQECLKSYKSANCNSKQADEMLLSKTLFDNTIVTGGYVAPEDFNTDYYTGGSTRLFDAIIERRQRLLDYMNQLEDNGTRSKACMVIFSDGKDNDSTARIGDARKAVEDLQKKEITVAFIAFGQKAFGIADQLGIKPKNVKEVTNNESELREVINLTSKSVISASKRASAGAGSSDGGFFDI